MMNSIDCSVVILNWNKRELLRRSLSALHVPLPDERLELIVVDNGSTDGSVEMVRTAFPDVTIVANGANLGPAGGRNAGLRIARGELVLLLDDDTTISPPHLRALLAIARAHPEAGIVSCMKTTEAGDPLYTYHVGEPPTMGWAFFLFQEWSLKAVGRALRRFWRIGESTPHRSEDLAEIHYIGSAVLLTRRQAIEEVGLMDDNIFFYGEDFDWCYRFRLKGWKILYAPQIRVISGHSMNAARTRRASVQSLRSRRYLFSKYIGRKFLPIYALMALTGLIPKLLYYTWFSQGGPSDISTTQWLISSIRCAAGLEPHPTPLRQHYA